jgi:hypothetical protein
VRTKVKQTKLRSRRSTFINGIEAGTKAVFVWLYVRELANQIEALTERQHFYLLRASFSSFLAQSELPELDRSADLWLPAVSIHHNISFCYLDSILGPGWALAARARIQSSPMLPIQFIPFTQFAPAIQKAVLATLISPACYLLPPP